MGAEGVVGTRPPRVLSRLGNAPAGHDVNRLVAVIDVGGDRAEIRLEPFSWKEPRVFSTVVLQIGSATWSRPWLPLCTFFELDEVVLEEGPASVRAWADAGEAGRQAALYVDLERIER